LYIETVILARMKVLLKIILFLLPYFFATMLFAQSTGTPVPDDEMNIFLMAFACLFLGAMLGAAVLGAILATLLFLLALFLVSFGVLSTSFLIGLYKRSLAAGFKSLLLLCFGLPCAVFGLAAAFLFNHIMPLHLPGLALALTGLLSGCIGGLLLGLVAFALSKKLWAGFSKRLQLN